MRTILFAAISAAVAVGFLAACDSGGGGAPPKSKPAEPTQAEMMAAEQAEREAAERERLAREEAERLERERLEREAAERAEREAAERAAARLPFPVPEWMCQFAHIAGACGIDGPIDSPHYGIWALPDQTEADAKRMPVHHDHDGNDRRIFVGVDQGEKATDYFTINGHISSFARSSGLADLPTFGERGDIGMRYGPLSDGAGRAALAKYLSDASRGRAAIPRWPDPPEVRLIGTSTASERQRLIAAVQLVNAALPEAAKLTMGAFTDTPPEPRPYGVIDVEFVDCYGPRHSCGSSRSTAASTAITRDRDDVIEHSYIVFSRETSSYGDDRQTAILLAHELMHSLGLYHVSAATFATILEGGGAIHHAEQNGQPQPLSLLYSIDREALQALYGRLGIGDSPQSFGNWSAVSTHLAGNGPHANFGVALRNGYREPWAHGYLPHTDLADNTALSGTVTWSGALVGFEPYADSVTGDAAISVNLATLGGAAAFTRLERWAAGSAPGEPGTGAVWGDGDLGYTIMVDGNTFRETGGDDGRLTGIFTGTAHEGAAGTLERTDLTAAFGASR